MQHTMLDQQQLVSRPLRFIVFIFFLFSGSIAAAQSGLANENFKVNIIPPSPEAAALAQYADIPVGLYSGIPEISIPLYELTERTLSLPIYMSYHASGNKVEALAPRTGLGWSLQAQGSISRTIRGLPDEFPSRGFLAQSQLRPISDYNTANDNDRSIWLDDLANGCHDLEPDLFYFNFGTYSGTFTFNWNGTITIASGSNIKLVRNPSLSSWTAVGEDGTIYTFDVTETADVLEYGDAAIGCNLLLKNRNTPQAWYVSKIESANKESWIAFEYENSAMRTFSLASESKNHNIYLAPAETRKSITRTISQNKLLKKITTSSGQTTIEFINGQAREDYDNVKPVGDNLTFVGYTLGEVIVKNRRGTIVKDWRLGYDYSIGRLTLKTLTEFAGALSKPPYQFNYQGSIGVRQLFHFNQDHWGFSNDNTALTLIPAEWATPILAQNPILLEGANREPSTTGALQGVLKEIVYPTGGKDVFEFELHDYSYENGQEIHEELPGQPVTHGGFAPSDQVNYGEWDVRDVDFTVPVGVNALDVVADFSFGYLFGGTAFPVSVKITNLTTNQQVYLVSPGGAAHEEDGGVVPTYQRIEQRINNIGEGQYRLTISGRRRFAAHPLGNSVAANISFTPPSGQYRTTKIGGGIRIASIRRSFGNGNPDKVTFYKYREVQNGVEKSSGSLTETGFVYSAITNYYEQLVGGEPSFPSFQLRQKYSRFSQNRCMLGATKGSHVGYSRVEVWNGDNAKYGKTIHVYTSAKEFPDYSSMEMPYSPAQSYDYARGLLKEKTDLDQFGRLVKKVENQYSFPNERVFGLKVGWAITGGYTGAAWINKYALGFYENVLGYTRLTTTTETDFFTGASPLTSVVNKKVFSYNENGHKQVSQITHYESDGDSTFTEMIYPGDFSPATATAVVKDMQARNMQNQVLESISWKYGLNGEKLLLSGTSTTFAMNNNKIVASAMVRDTLRMPLVTTNPLELARQLYEGRLIYSGYDFTYVNLLEHSLKNGMTTAYVWGEKGTVVLAKADNARARQIYYTSFEEESTGISTQQHKTGRQSKIINGVYTIPTANRPAYVGDYVLSWWEKVGAAVWMYKEKIIQGYTVGATISTDVVNGYIDEVRLFPKGAKMTTFTYEPLVGVTSVTDTNNVTIYFEYDEFNRLTCQRDFDRNILMWYDYKYQQEP